MKMRGALDSRAKTAGSEPVRKPFKSSPIVPHVPLMSKAETLQRIKEAEAQTRTAKEAAEREREITLRNGRREALELLDTFRVQAEKRYAEILAAAEAEVATERDRMLAAAREEAARIAARARANVDKAVELVLSKFRGAVRVYARTDGGGRARGTPGEALVRHRDLVS